MPDLIVYDIIAGVTEGLKPVLITSVSPDYFTNDGRIFLFFVNGATEAIVTVDAVIPCEHGVDHNVVVTVPASEDRMIGPFPKDRFNDGNGKVKITYDNVTTITVTAIRLPA